MFLDKKKSLNLFIIIKYNYEDSIVIDIELFYITFNFLNYDLK